MIATINISLLLVNNYTESYAILSCSSPLPFTCSESLSQSSCFANITYTIDVVLRIFTGSPNDKVCFGIFGQFDTTWIQHRYYLILKRSIQITEVGETEDASDDSSRTGQAKDDDAARSFVIAQTDIMNIKRCIFIGLGCGSY